MSHDRARQLTLQATSRQDLNEALHWIAEGHPLGAEVSVDLLLQAVSALPVENETRQGAARRLTRLSTESHIDSASLLPVSTPIPSIADLREALDAVARKCPSGTLGSISAQAVIAARRENPAVIEVLCASAGLGYDDLRMRLRNEIPARLEDHWTPSQVRAAFEVIDSVVRGSEVGDVAGTIPVRPVEFVSGWVDSGWETIEQLAQSGLPYEVLLAQRLVGDSWKQSTKNQVSNIISRQVAEDLANLLLDSEIEFERSSRYGGESSAGAMAAASGVPSPAILVTEGTAPTHAIVISMARDGGTARKNVNTMLNWVDRALCAVSVVALGPGWSARNETTDLALALGGRVFSERRLGSLVGGVVTASGQT